MRPRYNRLRERLPRPPPRGRHTGASSWFATRALAFVPHGPHSMQAMGAEVASVAIFLRFSASGEEARVPRGAQVALTSMQRPPQNNSIGF